MTNSSLGILVGAMLALGCSGAPPVSATSAPPADPPPPTSLLESPLVAPPLANTALGAWLSARLPPGGVVSARPDGSPLVRHILRDGENIDTVADAYLELTHYFRVEDLARALRDENQVASGEGPEVGAQLDVPGIFRDVPQSPAEGRLGLPEDKALRGVHVRSFVAAGKHFGQLLDQMAARGMNVVVLDVKDADGKITFPSQVALASEIGAVKAPAIRHLARVIQFVHEHGIRVSMRIVCFHDELLARVRGDLAVQSLWGKPLRGGWLDPKNDEAQQYLIDLATEAMDAGADEIQLDYVRYPVEKIEGADFGLKGTKLTKPKVIRDFVRRMHEITQPRNVALAVDVFGIVAEGVRQDLENLGQDPILLSRECEVLAPMVYPSHYPKGFLGYEEPGDHPELVQFGVTKLLALLHKGAPRAQVLVRPWIQGMRYHAPSFGAQYIADEVAHAKRGGAAGWMLWNPSQNYTEAWQAVTPISNERRPSRESTTKKEGPHVGG